MTIMTNRQKIGTEKGGDSVCETILSKLTTSHKALVSKMGARTIAQSGRT